MHDVDQQSWFQLVYFHGQEIQLNYTELKKLKGNYSEAILPAIVDRFFFKYHIA